MADARHKLCARCGEPFECCAGGCWCDEVSLDAVTRAVLAARYSDCLCAKCLRAAEDRLAGPAAEHEQI